VVRLLTRRPSRHTERYQFDATRFNALPDIEVASADMKAKGKLSLAFSALAPIFARHNMCDSWGISLLHNHWQVEDGELPIQDAIRTDSPLEYETTPRQAPFTKKYWPSILAARDSHDAGLDAVEFSTQPDVETANCLLVRNSQFVSEVCSALRENNLADTFGLIVPKEVSSADLEFVEFNEDKVSLLKETVSATNDPQNLIETSWRIVPTEVAGKCEKSCFSKCVVSGGKHSHSHPKVHKP
jgi:hypothetical protein